MTGRRCIELITFEWVIYQLFINGHLIIKNITEEAFEKIVEAITPSFNEDPFEVIDVKGELYRRITVYLKPEVLDQRGD